MGKNFLELTTPEEAADYLAKIAGKALKPKKKHKSKPKKPKAPPQAQVTAEQPITLNLRASHNINGHMYGPGQVTVAPTLAAALREQDQRAAHYDDTWRDEKAVVVQPSSRGGYLTQRVSPALFDAMEIPAIGSAGKTGFKPA